MKELLKYATIVGLTTSIYILGNQPKTISDSNLEIKINAPRIQMINGRDLLPQRVIKNLENIDEPSYVFQTKDMETSITGINLIKDVEKFSAVPYLDVNRMAIGYGYQIKEGENYKKITKRKAEELLEKDIEWVNNTISKNVEATLTQNQYDAITSFVYNIGETNFRSSDLLEKLNNKNYSGAAEEFKRWVWADGEILKGLEERRQIEYELFLTPETKTNKD